MGIRLSSAIRLHYLRSLFGQTIHVLDSMPSGAAASTITATANVLQLGISEKLGVFIEFVATIIASVVVAFTYNWELTLVTSSVILFIFCVLGVLLPFILKGHARMTRVRYGSAPAQPRIRANPTANSGRGKSQLGCQRDIWWYSDDHGVRRGGAHHPKVCPLGAGSKEAWPIYCTINRPSVWLDCKSGRPDFRRFGC